MSRFQLRTVRGYGFGEVSSAMQKAIHRADVQLAGYWALELWWTGCDTAISPPSAGKLNGKSRR